MTVELAVVGGGRMGEALAEGLLRAGWAAPGDITIVERDEGRRQDLLPSLAQRYPGLRVAERIPACAGAIVAVKPGDVEAACAGLAAVGAGRVLSIAAGVTLARLEEWLGVNPPAPMPPGAGPGEGPPAVLRAMPNTAALIGAGASAVAAGTTAGAGDLEWASSILASVGTVVEVSEPLLDAVTGLSGSGPAYVFLLAEAMIDAGVLVGLPRAVAHDLVVQTVLGSARLLAESGRGPESLRAGVTSPGGTTAVGLRALEAAGFRSAVLDAVAAATEQARQLGS